MKDKLLMDRHSSISIYHMEESKFYVVARFESTEDECNTVAIELQKALNRAQIKIAKGKT